MNAVNNKCESKLHISALVIVQIAFLMLWALPPANSSHGPIPILTSWFPHLPVWVLSFTVQTFCVLRARKLFLLTAVIASAVCFLMKHVVKFPPCSFSHFRFQRALFEINKKKRPTNCFHSPKTTLNADPGGLKPRPPAKFVTSTKLNFQIL